MAELIDLYLNMSHRELCLVRRGQGQGHGGDTGTVFDDKAIREAMPRSLGLKPLGSDRLHCGPPAVVVKRLDTGSVWLFQNHPNGPFF